MGLRGGDGGGEAVVMAVLNSEGQGKNNGWLVGVSAASTAWKRKEMVRGNGQEICASLILIDFGSI